ncbi:class I SAM-dependent methyltransferase [Streptomyces sp. NPDC058773]|uniref:class I SAM-dependent methyltransferase n=1 Tax=Streptomyces sp. NPDC058773 TaxID=3346632 RepID=UPI0036843B9B
MFLIEAARDMRTTGAIAPSSAALARALTEPVRARAGRPLNVLEAGAGTGAVTRALIPQLPSDSHLDVAEANPRFAARLHRLATPHPHLPEHGKQVRIHTRRVEELDTDRRYDVIVSGLPFANFTRHNVETIMDRYLELLHPGGTLTYFAYLGAPLARGLLTSRAQALRQRAVEDLLTDYQHRCTTGFRTVWGNLPPAKVWQLTQAPHTVARPNHATAGAGQ